MGYGKWIYMIWITSFTCAQHPIFSLRQVCFSRKWSKTPLLSQAISFPLAIWKNKVLKVLLQVILIFGLCQCGLFLCGKGELFFILCSNVTVLLFLNLRWEQCGLGALKDHDVIACMMSAEPGHAVPAVKHTCALL